MKEKLLSEDGDSLNLQQYISDFCTKLILICQLAQDHLKSSQNSMKDRYDKYTNEHNQVIMCWCYFQFLVDFTG